MSSKLYATQTYVEAESEDTETLVTEGYGLMS
jgi:hypothetical protein